MPPRDRLPGGSAATLRTRKRGAGAGRASKGSHMRLGSKAKLTIGIGLVAAGAFGFLGVRELSRPAAPEVQARTPAAAPQPSMLVLAASTRTIRIGETITADMIRNAAFAPGRYPSAATPAEVIGQVATRDIPPNTLIPRSVIGRDAKLAIRVPVGMRAITIDSTAEIAVAGLVRPGDRVDVQVVYPGEDAISGARGNGSSRARTLLQMVPVLAVGDAVIGTRPPATTSGEVVGAVASASGAQPGAGAIPARTVTLALTPAQVSELSLAKNIGTLALSLRNPDDRDQVEVAQIASSPNRATPPASAPVFAAPAAMQPAAARPAPRQASRSESHGIELVVGGNREVIYTGSGAR